MNMHLDSMAHWKNELVMNLLQPLISEMAEQSSVHRVRWESFLQIPANIETKLGFS
jgi:hypothetical protein